MKPNSHDCTALEDSGYTSVQILYFVEKSSLTGKTRREWSMGISGNEEITWTTIQYCPFCGEKLEKETKK
jgi:hypothetical protein